MEKTNFWSDALKCGLGLGAVLGLSAVVEPMLSLSGKPGLYVLLAVEWIAVVVLHYYILHRYTAARARLYSVEEGFTFGQGYGYLLAVSAVAGVLVSIVQYLFIYVVIGYANYTDKIVAGVTAMMARNGGISGQMEALYAQSLQQLQNAPEPSIFAALRGPVVMSLLFGAVFGLIIAGVLSRAPKPFSPEENQ